MAARDFPIYDYWTDPADLDEAIDVTMRLARLNFLAARALDDADIGVYDEDSDIMQDIAFTLETRVRQVQQLHEARQRPPEKEPTQQRRRQAPKRTPEAAGPNVVAMAKKKDGGAA